MILKSDVEKSFLLQQQTLAEMPASTPRTCLDVIEPGNTQIQVISGIRRCGKSTLMRQLMEKSQQPIAYINFEDPRIFNFELNDFPKLDEIIGDGITHYYFDEIQNVPQWEIYIRQLHDRGKKIFVTGSNASLLSKELGTRLTGRHLRHELFPFSYAEFLRFNSKENNPASFDEYQQDGGFPEFLKKRNPEVLQMLLKDIVLRDIAVRHGVKNTSTLMNITLFLLSNIGKPHTYNSLKKNFSVGSANSVSDYLSWLEDSYLLFFLNKFSWSTKKIVMNPRKVYAVDNGLINANTLSFTKDKGRLLENLVYMFLRQKFPRLFYFRENGECDFVVFEKNQCQMLVQVCESLDSDNQAREINGLTEAMRFFGMNEGSIITKDQADTLNVVEGKIRLIPAYEFITAN